MVDDGCHVVFLNYIVDWRSLMIIFFKSCQIYNLQKTVDPCRTQL